MKRYGSKALIVSIILVVGFYFSSPVQGQDLQQLNYVSFRGGIFLPTSDLDELDNGFYLDAMYNRYLSRNFAIEAGVGLYYSEATYSGVLPIIGAYTEKDSISVMPVMFNLKGIFPFPAGEFYVGGGVGLYLATGKAEVTSTGLGSFSFDDSDAVFGGQFKAGIIFNLTQKLFLGIEGMYMLTDTAEFTDQFFGVPVAIETDLNGYTINGVFGFRF